MRRAGGAPYLPARSSKMLRVPIVTARPPVAFLRFIGVQEGGSF
jgi:hypothetical protein